jgi:hypothetical protein
MKEELSSSETSVLIRATWRNVLEDAIFHSRCKTSRMYVELTFWHARNNTFNVEENGARAIDFAL